MTNKLPDEDKPGMVMLETGGQSVREMPLPPSLAVKPNIPYDQQTIEQLYLERAYWQWKLHSALSWGASVGAASAYADMCTKWINLREKEEGDRKKDLEATLNRLSEVKAFDPCLVFKLSPLEQKRYDRWLEKLRKERPQTEGYSVVVSFTNNGVGRTVRVLCGGYAEDITDTSSW